MLELIKNKHMILAMFIAPVLAIATYFATDRLIATPPEPAQSGQTYPLAARSNCRYESGICTLKNGDIEIHFRVEKIDQNFLTLSAQTSVPVQNVLVALTPHQQNTNPSAMKKNSQTENQWRITIALPRPSSNIGANETENNEASELKINEKATIPLNELVLRIAVLADGATFFAETGTDFFSYDTIFSRENFSAM